MFHWKCLFLYRNYFGKKNGRILNDYQNIKVNHYWLSIIIYIFGVLLTIFYWFVPYSVVWLSVLWHLNSCNNVWYLISQSVSQSIIQMINQLGGFPVSAVSSSTETTLTFMSWWEAPERTFSPLSASQWQACPSVGGGVWHVTQLASYCTTNQLAGLLTVWGLLIRHPFWQEVKQSDDRHAPKLLPVLRESVSSNKADGNRKQQSSEFMLQSVRTWSGWSITHQ